jgi:ribosomal protein S27E
MTTRSPPRRHWRSDGTEPLPSGAEAMDEPSAAFPSWFLRIECDRCGKVQMVNEAHASCRSRCRSPCSGDVRRLRG